MMSFVDPSYRHDTLVPLRVEPAGFRSELQTALASGIGQCRHPAMIPVSTPVETDSQNPFRLRPFSKQFANMRSRGLIAAIGNALTDFRFDGSSGNQSHTLIVIDELSIDVLGTTEYSQTGTLRSTVETSTGPQLPPFASD